MDGRYDAHVREINTYVDSLMDQCQKWLPYVAPTYGGVEAHLLSLFQDPGPKTQVDCGTNMLSVENPDYTAERYLALLTRAGIKVSDTLSWNAYPWYLGYTGRVDNRPSDSQILEGVPVLAHLLTLLPKLHVVLLQGAVAWDSWAQLSRMYPDLVAPLRVVRTYHTSLQVVDGKSAPERQRRETKLANDFRLARDLLDRNIEA